MSDGTSQLADAVNRARTEQRGYSEQSGRSEQSGQSEQFGQSEQSGRSAESGTNSSTGISRGKTATNGSSWSKSQTRGKSITRKQTLVPRILTREVVTAVQYFTTEEQFLEAARDLTRLPCGTCFLYLAGQGVCEVRIPLARHPWQGLPKYTAKKVAELRGLILSRPEFDTTENLQRSRIEFERRLITFLNDVSQAKEARLTESTPILIVPTTSDNSLIQI